MFSLTIVCGPGPMAWTLMFKEKTDAMNAMNAIGEHNGKFLETEDDFGQRVVIEKNQAHGFMLEDLEQSRLAHIERALHQARTQAKGAELAEADPVLKQARHRAQGGILPMIQPMPAGFGPNGGFRG
jgi:hypothetical protein